MSSLRPELADYYRARPQIAMSPLRGGIVDRIRSTFRRAKPMAVDECADTIRKLPSTNAISGQWITATKEIGRGPMRAVTERGVNLITAMACTQLFKTALLENVILYFTVVDPSPMIVIEPNKGMAEDLYHNKVKPMFDLTRPALRRTRKMRVGRIAFDGGFIKFANARSTVNIAMNAVRVVMNDETDKAPIDKIHGDPIDNSEKRNSTFGRRKLSIRVCSPSTEQGRIYQSYMSSDQRRPFVTCPHCQHSHVMRWRQWTPELARQHALDTDNPEPYDYNVVRNWQQESIMKRMDADGGHQHDEFGKGLYAYHCPSCRKPWTDFQHRQALRKIVWRQTKAFTCCGRVQHPEIEESWVHEDGNGRVLKAEQMMTTRYVIGYATCSDCGRRKVPRQHAGFWANRFYDPEANATSIMETWFNVQGGVGNRKTFKEFVNSDMAEVFVEQAGINMTANRLRFREEEYDAPMPRRAAVVTMGVDTQKNRLAIGIYAHGRNSEIWLLRYVEIPGDPKITGPLSVWGDRNSPESHQCLHNILKVGFPRADGRMERIKMACVDIQGDAEWRKPAIDFCRAHQPQTLAIVGKKESGNNDYAPMWPKNGAKLGQDFYEIGTHSLKDMVATQLSTPRPGPYYFHFPLGQEEEYYNMLLSEKKQQRPNSNRLWWEKIRDRNEALDVTAYAIAAKVAMETISDIRLDEWADRLGIPTDVLPSEEPMPAAAREEKAALVAEKGGSVLTPAPAEDPKPVPMPFIAAKRPMRGRGYR